MTNETIEKLLVATDRSLGAVQEFQAVISLLPAQYRPYAVALETAAGLVRNLVKTLEAEFAPKPPTA
jgi:hypothetical protein